MRPPYDSTLEHSVIGEYLLPKSDNFLTSSDKPPVEPRLYRPIEPRENLKMFIRGEVPYWVPSAGWANCDLNMFRPRQHPDNLANHQLFDGGPKFEYESLPDIVEGWFGIPYKFDHAVNGATVEPGCIKISDVTCWEDYIDFPDLDAMNWDEIETMNRDFMNTDKANQLGIQFGLWERLMNLMGVEGAAIALIDEDEKEGVKRLFDRLADLYIDFIGRMCERVRIDAVFFHDDWGTANAPFFSLATCREMIVPYIKRITSYCHSKGILFEHHCCGNAESLVPAMIEEGDDFWVPQPALNDLDRLLEDYKDAPIAFGIPAPAFPPGTTQEQITDAAVEWLNKYSGKRAILVGNFSVKAELNLPEYYPLFKDALYKASREKYQKEANCR